MLDDDRSPVWAAGQLHDGDHRRADVVQDWPPGVAVRVYERLLSPPVEAGTFQVPGPGATATGPPHEEPDHARQESFPCTTLRNLSLPYTDQHDYNPRWRPESSNLRILNGRHQG